MRDRTVLQHIASSVARLNCIPSSKTTWENRHEAMIEYLVKNHLPSGSGFDSGTQIDLDKSTGDKLLVSTSFHHMNEGGHYDGWTEHVITVTPAFDGFNLRIGGRDRNDIKDYIGDSFHHDLSTTIPHDEYVKICRRLYPEAFPTASVLADPINPVLAELGQ
jgi:hypothetical protein